MIEALKSLLKQASSARSSGEAAEAERLYKEAAAQAEADEAIERAEALSGIAQTRRDSNDRTGAAIYYAEAITLLRAAAATAQLAHALSHAAEIRSEMSEYGTAGTQIEEAIRLYRDPGNQTDPLDLANALRVSALNDERRALSAWAEAESLYAAANVTEGVAESRQHLHRLAPTEQEQTA